jgi:hypothetical protein
LEALMSKNPYIGQSQINNQLNHDNIKPGDLVVMANSPKKITLNVYKVLRKTKKGAWKVLIKPYDENKTWIMQPSWVRPANLED